MFGCGLNLKDDFYFEQTLHLPLRLLFEGGFYFTRNGAAAASICGSLRFEGGFYSSKYGGSVGNIQSSVTYLYM